MALKRLPPHANHAISPPLPRIYAPPQVLIYISSSFLSATFTSNSVQILSLLILPLSAGCTAIASQEEEIRNTGRECTAPMEEETKSNPTVENGVEYPFGTETEILRIGGTELSLLDRNRRVKILRTGDLAVRIVRHSGSPLGISVCSVGDHHWPLARDGPVIRVGSHRFSFALPGYFCCLKVPLACSENDLKKLEGIFAEFCAYEDHYGKTSAFNFPTKSETGFWALVATMIENVSNEMLTTIATGDYRNHLRRPSDMAHTVQRAVRMSAMTKLVTQTLLRGAIKFHSHVQMVGPGPIAWPRTAASAGELPVFPSISTFVDVLGAVETYGESIDGWPQVGPSRTRCWKINKVGLTVLLMIVLAGSAKNRTKNQTAPVPARVRVRVRVKEEVEQ